MGLRRAYIELHIAVVLLGLTAILGDLITLSATVLVWWRTLIAAIGIGLFLWITNRIRMDWIRTQKKIYALGGLIAIHWICFFGSIKLANASTALICFATISFFTAWIEPMITKRKREMHEIVFGLMVIPGIVLIAGQAEGQLMTGIILGIIAAFLVAVISSLQKKWITQIDAEHMTFIQLIGAWFAMCIWMIGEYLYQGIDHFLPGRLDFILLLILGLLCTSVAWVLATRAMRNMTAFDSMIVINLEPVYGILMALLFLGDSKELTLTFYIGASIILISVILHPIWQSRYART